MKEGNPCSPATGNKFQTETDYSAGANASLNFSRHYNSQGEYRHGKHLAPSWRPSISAAMDAPPSQDYIGLAGGDASSAYATPEAACLEGFAEIKATVWGGALAKKIKGSASLIFIILTGKSGVWSYLLPSPHR